MTSRHVEIVADIIGQGAKGLALARELVRDGVRTRSDLRRVLGRLPRASQASVLFNPARRTKLSTAQDIADEVVRRLRFKAAPKARVVAVGSVRRLAPMSKDFDFLVITESLELVLDTAELRGAGRLSIVDTYAGGSRRRSIIVRREASRGNDGSSRGRATHYKVDLFAATREEAPFALYHHTGSSDYNIRLRAHAKKRGWRLNQYGLYDATTGRRVRKSGNIKTEHDLARFLGVSYREPSERDSI